MRLLITGANGLIGSHVVAALSAAGHDIVATGRGIRRARTSRPDISWVHADFTHMTAALWAPLLAGIDGVVNCAGALQDSPRDNLAAVHVDGLRHLCEACRIAGITRFVHISAAGLAEARTTAFNHTKLAAEAALRESPLDWIILRPGLVLAPAAYGGSALLRGLAGLPGITPIVHGESLIQPVAIEDLTEAVRHALAPEVPKRVTIDLMHDQPIPLAALVPRLRRWLGLTPAPIIHLPPALIRSTARICDGLAYLGWRSPMRTTTLEQLRQGITGNSADAARLGLTLRSLDQMLNLWVPGVQERWFARLYFVKPANLIVLSLFWLISGIIGLLREPQAAALLTQAGMGQSLADLQVVGGSLADIALGFAVAWRRAAPAALIGMVAVSAAYMLGGVICRPDLWLDPLGPFVKTIPAAMLALATLAIMDER
ncbi:MAG TPA: SDR family oxidoreductase [Stellaceae bacterium]|jgi:uncharacterized protein YbjT (DUF2867 family)|nr:SDR family oxidoreductase [Stellaceae bacterium]